MDARENWTTRVAFILATLGFSAGIGNLWRFPYLVGQHGGGVFLLFYLLTVLLIAIPLFSIEITLGKATGKDPVGAYKSLAPRSLWHLNGYLNVFTMFLISGYAASIIGTIFAYLFKSAVGTFSELGPLEIEAYYGAFSTDWLELMIWTALTVAIITTILSQGLVRGVERANKIMMPALFIIMIILLVRALTLSGASEGLSFYLKPDFDKFSWAGVVAAIGHSFFAVGVAMAVALVYGSYLPRGSKHVISNAVIIAALSTVIGVMAGLVIFPSIFTFGLDPASGTGLTFITMPNVFNQMPAGTFFGTLFFLLFFLAAITSFIGAYEAIIAFLRDQYGIPRSKGVWITGGGVLVLASITAFSSRLFLIADYLSNDIFLILGALVMSIFVGWVWGIPRFAEAAGIQSVKTAAVWAFLIKFLIPMLILVCWIAQLRGE
jgi:NSS family neurotransmitter:Na+ symporter